MSSTVLSVRWKVALETLIELAGLVGR